MYRVKPILGFIAVVAFLAVVVGGVDAGPLADKKLLVDTVFNMVDSGDKVNEGINTLSPVAAGDTVNVELFIEEGGGVGPITGASVRFADGNEEMMFSASWKIVGFDPVRGISGLLSVNPDSGIVSGGGIPGEEALGDNGYLGTVKIEALVDIADGSSFVAESATINIGLGANLTTDELDVSEAIVTFAVPTGPTVRGMGDTLMRGNMIQIPAMGGSASVTVSVDNLPDDPTISYTVTTMGEGTLTVMDEAGGTLDLDDHMMVSADKIVLSVTGGSLQVTVKATVNDEDTAPVTFTFTQLNPAELASFDGALQTDRVVLNWSTVSQTNNAGWRIMRSVDGETFEAVGNFVQGAGTSDALMNYTFEDKDLPGADRVYYRLEQVDLDGSISQSNVIEVLLGARMPLPTEFAVNVYPNPFNPSTTISYDLPEAGAVTVVIYDVLGQQVRRLVSQVASAGRYSIQWDARDNQGRGVASGVYIAKVDAGASTLSQKMLLLK